jgi:hypothetical protein
MYLGAGHIDWKVAVGVEAFLKATNAMVCDMD